MAHDGLGLWAAPPRADFLWPILLLVGAMLVGAVIILWVDRWRKRAARASRPEDELPSFQSLYEKGELSREEFAKIRLRLEKKAPPPAAAAPPDSPKGPAIPDNSA